MTNFSEHKKMFIKLMLSIVAFSVLILSAVLIPSSYASWQRPQGGNSLTIGEITTTQYYNVVFNSMGGTAVEDQAVEVGTKPQKPADPTRENYEFAGWYKESACTNVFNFETETVTKTTTIYAKWTEKQTTPDKPTDSTGGDVKPPKFGQGIIITDSTGKAERTVESNLPVATNNLQASITVKEGDLLWFYNGNNLQDLNSNAFSWLVKVDGITGCYKVVTGGTYSINYLPNTGLLN